MIDLLCTVQWNGVKGMVIGLIPNDHDVVVEFSDIGRQIMPVDRLALVQQAPLRVGDIVELESGLASVVRKGKGEKLWYVKYGVSGSREFPVARSEMRLVWRGGGK